MGLLWQQQKSSQNKIISRQQIEIGRQLAAFYSILAAVSLNFYGRHNT